MDNINMFTIEKFLQCRHIMPRFIINKRFLHGIMSNKINMRYGPKMKRGDRMSYILLIKR